MADDNQHNESIRSLFDSAASTRASLDSFPNTVNDAYQSALSTAISDYRKCKDLISRASLFSLNEGLEEIATADMRYLVTDFHLGELSMKTKSDDRKAVLELSRSYYKDFLGLCDAYGLLTSADKSAAESASDPSLSVSSLPSDPGARRTAKIAQFRREKELNSQVESLSTHADEEEVRTYHRAHILLCIMRTIQSLESIKLELDILSKAPRPSAITPHIEDDQRQRGTSAQDYSERLDVLSGSIKGGALLSKDGKPLRPFRLVNQREELKAGVFRPGHNLPTMTIDEYLEEERARGGIIEGGGEKSGIRPEPNEDDIEAADRETMKAREWDEFKEANPRGAGNTLNRG